MEKNSKYKQTVVVLSNFIIVWDAFRRYIQTFHVEGQSTTKNLNFINILYVLICNSKVMPIDSPEL